MEKVKGQKKKMKMQFSLILTLEQNNLRQSSAIAT